MASRWVAGLACFLVLLSAARAAQDAVNLGKDVVKDFQQCDRDCRWVYGFYEKDITGTRVNADGSEDEWFGEHCLCSRAGRPLMEPNLIRRSVKKTWDDRFWCGDFQTSNVCAMSLSTGEVGTTTRQAAAANESELHVLHCGACGACSQPDDLMVLHDTKTFITTKMTKCSIKFSMPEILGGTHDLDALTECLRNEGITFNETNSFRWDSRLQAGGPGLSCMDCWTDDIQCDAVHCKLDCIRKFFDPNNNGKYEVSQIPSSFVPDPPPISNIYLSPSLCHQECLKCDENTCGPAFIKCAGANRRSSGIISDIDRVSSEVCPIGHFTRCSQCELQCHGDEWCLDECKKLPSCQNPKRLVKGR